MFLGQAAGLGAAGVLFSSAPVVAQQGFGPQSPTLSCNDEAIGPQAPGQRRNTSYRLRVDAARQERELGVPCHDRNDDEQLYGDLRASYSKGLVHDSLGEVDPASYQSMIDALESGDPDDFELVQIGNPGGAGPAPGNTPVHKLINP